MIFSLYIFIRRVESADHQIRCKITTAPMEGITMDIDDGDKGF